MMLGGLLLVGTINRTPVSWLVYILWFELLLALSKHYTHDWRLFITPAELHDLLLDAGFQVSPRSEILGFGPKDVRNTTDAFVRTNHCELSYLWYVLLEVFAVCLKLPLPSYCSAVLSLGGRGSR